MLQMQSLFNSAMVIFKPELCSNVTLTGISIVLLKGILVYKVQT